MRKKFALLGLLAALAIPATAFAVDLHDPHVGTTCEHGGTFHFVAPGGDASSRLDASFSGGGSVADLAPTKVTGGTAHWTIDAIGTLQSASATNADKLVLSDFTCDEKKGGGGGGKT
jgi:hypothetical protein